MYNQIKQTNYLYAQYIYQLYWQLICLQYLQTIQLEKTHTPTINNTSNLTEFGNRSESQYFLAKLDYPLRRIVSLFNAVENLNWLKRMVRSRYTKLGKIVSTTSYQYDSDNRLSRIDYPTGNFIAYLYDDNGNRTQVQTASQTVTYTFDALNRSQSVTDTSGITTYGYDNVGNRATQSNANGTLATYTYDNLNRLIDLTHTDNSSNVIANYAYTLGANGNRLRIAEATGRIVDYTYDDLYRLLTETITDPVNGNHATEFAYDAVGNREQQTKDAVTTTYVYDNNDQIQSETENAIVTSYAYDNNGNTLSKTIDAVVDTSYSYDNDNRMVQAITPTSTITNTYDAGGIRQSQTVDGVLTNYLVDQNRSYAQVLEEQNDLFIAQTTYVYGDDLISQTNAQGTHTFGYDGLGSTRILTDVAGTVQNAYGYEAFGEVDYQLGSIENKYLFTGEQYDNNVGFYYLRARFYNPDNGRFVKMDTFAGMMHEPVTLHKYLYANVNPISFIDPSGNISIGGLMATLRNAAIQARYAISALSRKVLNFVRKKKTYKVFTHAEITHGFIPHLYMSVKNISKKTSVRYDVGLQGDRPPSVGEVLGQPFKIFGGIITSERVTSSNPLRGKRIKVAKFTFLQWLLWHQTVKGTFEKSCTLNYSIIPIGGGRSNCISWTIKATAKAIIFSKIKI